MMKAYLRTWLADKPNSQTSLNNSQLPLQSSRYYHNLRTTVCPPQSRVCERDLLNGKDAGSG